MENCSSFSLLAEIVSDLRNRILFYVRNGKRCERCYVKFRLFRVSTLFHSFNILVMIKQKICSVSVSRKRLHSISSTSALT